MPRQHFLVPAPDAKLLDVCVQLTRRSKEPQLGSMTSTFLELD
jgi:hypothetical protein